MFVFKFGVECHWKLRNKVESLRSDKCLVGFAPKSFQLLYKALTAVANIYLFKVVIETLEKDVKHVQSQQ